MSKIQDLVNNALAVAESRLQAGVPKTASAPVRASALAGFKKEASEMANSLEYIALNAADDGSAKGAATTDMIRDFFKKANEKGPAVTETMASGTQGQVPDHGKTKIPVGKPGAHDPATSESPNGKGSRDIGLQAPPETKTPPKQAGMALYDVLMGSRKTANAGDPAVSETGTPAPQIPDKNENSNRHAALDTAEGMTNLTRREAKLPTRARLKELFASASDVTSDAAARAVWPNAAAKGDLKVASADDGGAAGADESESPKIPKKDEDKGDEKKEEKGSDDKKAPPFAKKEDTEKKGSLAEYSQFWDLALSGQAGPEAQEAAAGLIAQIEGK